MPGKLKTISEVVRNNQCTGCGGCAAVLPALLKMQETIDENRRPNGIEELNGSEHQIAASACPQIEENKPRSGSNKASNAWGPVLEVWEGYAEDSEIRFKGSSGGAITALALAAVDTMDFHGALHVKASKQDPRLNEAAISTNRAELLEGSGSRYAPASVCDGLHLIENVPAPNVVIGKPCDIRAVRRAAKVRPNELGRNIGLTISIFCAGTPSHKGTEALLQYLGSEKRGTLQKLKYRGEGWPGKMVANWKASSGAFRSHSTSYSKGWGAILQKYRQWSCMTCEDHTGEVADISVGDPWQNPTSEDESGSSLIVARTERGRAVLRSAMAKGYIHAKRQPNSVLFEAQPNLFATKGAVWGRKLAMRVFGMKTAPLSLASFRCWSALPLRQKAQSVAGTLKRIKRRKLHLRRVPLWLQAEDA
jgi:coenzyme F420 hydrogenase subunit beta